MAAFIPRLGRIQPVLLKSLQPSEVHLPPFQGSLPMGEVATSQRILDRLASLGQELPSNLRIMQPINRQQLAGLNSEQRNLVRLPSRLSLKIYLLT